MPTPTAHDPPVPEQPSATSAGEARSAAAVLRLGSALLVAAALAGLWEALASQSPGSSLYIGMLPGPIALLREALFTWGSVIVLAGLGLADAVVARRWIRALHVGAVLTLVSGVYAGATGMHGVQFKDLRPDATWLFLGKFLGRALLFAGLLACASKVLGRAQGVRSGADRETRRART